MAELSKGGILKPRVGWVHMNIQQTPDYLQDLKFPSYHQVAVWVRNHLQARYGKGRQNCYQLEQVSRLIQDELGLEPAQAEKTAIILRNEGYLGPVEDSMVGHLFDGLIDIMPGKGWKAKAKSTLGRTQKDNEPLCLELL